MSALTIEARLDNAFFSDEVMTLLEETGVKFTISARFERFAELKKMVKAHKQGSLIGLDPILKRLSRGKTF